jgi:hypothetical protein
MKSFRKSDKGYKPTDADRNRLEEEIAKQAERRTKRAESSIRALNKLTEGSIPFPVGNRTFFIYPLGMGKVGLIAEKVGNIFGDIKSPEGGDGIQTFVRRFTAAMPQTIDVALIIFTRGIPFRDSIPCEREQGEEMPNWKRWVYLTLYAVTKLKLFDMERRKIYQYSPDEAREYLLQYMQISDVAEFAAIVLNRFDIGGLLKNLVSLNVLAQ